MLIFLVYFPHTFTFIYVFIFKSGCLANHEFPLFLFAGKAFISPWFSNGVFPGHKPLAGQYFSYQHFRDTLFFFFLLTYLSLIILIFGPLYVCVFSSAFENFLFVFKFLHFECDMSGSVLGGIFVPFGIFWASWNCDSISLILGNLAILS